MNDEIMKTHSGETIVQFRNICPTCGHVLAIHIATIFGNDPVSLTNLYLEEDNFSYLSFSIHFHYRHEEDKPRFFSVHPSFHPPLFLAPCSSSLFKLYFSSYFLSQCDKEEPPSLPLEEMGVKEVCIQRGQSGL